VRQPTIYLAVMAASGALLAGCASTPRSTPELTDAHQAVQTLASQPRALQAAGPDLRTAQSDLKRADDALHAGAPTEEVNHLAYLALRHAQAGQERVDAARSQAYVARATQERQRLLLQSERERALTAQQQAQSEQQRAQSSQQQAQSAQEQARSAQQQAQSAQQQVRQAQQEAQQARAQAQQARVQAQQAQQQLANERKQYKQLQKQELGARQTDQGMVVSLSNVLFSTGKATLQPGAHLQLDRLADYLKDHPQQRVLIEGNTDSSGSAALNQKLSAARAQAVAQALQLRGVSSDQYQTIGLGEAYPVASNDTAAGRQQNRRVDVVFSNASGQFSEAALSRKGASRQ
jgi:outer membrane protein OmpA-like peptidoglycan-associated protein/outer membrane murein-binding lipoprotein Lpp